jgi:hypothetical protein
MSPRPTSLLNPALNFGIDVTVCTREQTRDEYGEIENINTCTVTKVIWAELGYRSKRYKEGKKVFEVVEVHLYPEFNGLVPGRDYIINEGIEYRIEKRLRMERMVGVVMYELLRELKDEP